MYDEIKRPDVDRWNGRAFRTRLGVVVAPEDYFEGEICLFSELEARQIEERLHEAGWRLPTAKEWFLLFADLCLDDCLMSTGLTLEDKIRTHPSDPYWLHDCPPLHGTEFARVRLVHNKPYRSPTITKESPP